jgi:magnesium chelatase family protein
VRRRVIDAIRFAARRATTGPGLAALALEPAASATLEDAAQAQGLSLRAVHRTARVARTIADLARERAVTRDAVLEALLFRPRAALTSLKVA